MSSGPSTERLARRLAEAEETIAALLSGQVDSVVDARSNTPLLLAEAQGALRQSEARYRHILETTEEGVWLTDASGATTFMNRSMAEMLGRRAEDCLGKPFADFLDADGQARLARYLESPEGEALEIRFDRLGGGSTWALLHAVPETGRDGAADGILAMVTDVTERRVAATALSAERDRAQRYLDTAEVFLVALDLNGCIILVNRYACTVLGRSAESLMGQPWIETCVPPRAHAELRARFASLLAGDLSLAENPVVTSSGEERMIEWRTTLEYDEQGRVTGTFSSGTDITDRDRAIEALRVAEERMRFTLRSTNIGIWDQDYRSGVLEWSDITREQYGFAEGSFDGTFDSFAAGIHPDDRTEALATIHAAMKSGGEFALRHRVLHSDGTVRFLSGAGRVMLDDRGLPLRAVGISQDVTEREDLERQYQHSQKMEAIGQLAGGIAHDFNNILCVVLGCGELLLNDLGALDPARDNAEEIVRAARRAADLTRQLLMFSRKQIVAPRVLDLADVTRQMAGMLRRVVGEDIALNFVNDEAPGSVRADPSSIEQVVLNLVVNARDAMPTGGSLTISTSFATIDATTGASGPLRALPPGRYIVLSVQDSGVGMNAATQQRVFEPFFTTKEVGKGTGLGLSTVFGIVQQNQGAVDVQSTVGVGTTFSVYLPQVDDKPEPATGPRTVTDARGTETILLVEDEDQVRAIARTILTRSGYNVIEMRTAADALLQCEHGKTHIDLLLTDVVMPLMSGPELARKVAAMQPTVRVLCMSGYTDDSMVRHGVIDGETAFLHKPFTAELLRRKVREVLDAGAA